MKGMIISVGGTTEPVVASLLTHQPDFVCFFASQQSLDTIGDIKGQIKEKGLSIEDYKVVCDDVNDLVHCYRKAVECTERLCASGCDQSSVVVDYTGGTKSMTAALTLATVAHGYKFSYVGGERRTKNGLGVVISGHEVVKTGVSPWQIFAVEEKKRIALFIATFQYEAAIAAMSQILGNLQAGESEVWSGIAETLDGFLAWDNFDHKTAVKRLSSGIHKLGLCERFGLEKPVGEYLQKTRDNFAILDKMNVETTFFAKMHPVFVGDLVANAGRRAQQSKYDDAVARLYRALEMIGQIAFTEQTGCFTDDVDPRRLPDALGEDFMLQHRSVLDGKVKIGLFATFQVLKEMGHPLGLRFFEHKQELNKLLTARNSSILAHGVTPIAKGTYEKMAGIIRTLFADEPAPGFPRLDW